MAVLVDEGWVRETGGTGTMRPAGPMRTVPRVRRYPSHPRPGETRRPPHRARVVAGHRPAGAARCAPRRLPVRWPWLAALALAAFLFVGGMGLLANGMATTEVPAQTTTVSVGVGESLWDVAERVAPDSDPAAVVSRIEELNGLGDAGDVLVAAGLPLTVPFQQDR
ncbi:hypothetical protein [Amycolatopsis nigrescens]|uniref:hypothetical protein n=1 Tax=Amycolatopsis nigrescens TaxID=381445 RepID=UPI00035E03F1|nr:hypothetical protein [Amycolatopsis nigrescens]